MKNILITGANFNNKGAQSMLFVTVSEIRKRNPESEIFFATTDSIEENLFSFKRVFYSYNAIQIALGTKALYTRFKCFVKDTIKHILRRKTDLWKYKELKQLLPKIDLMVDISGFGLGEKWTIRSQENYLDNIRLARKYSIPIILMPQSFGPFNYRDDKKYLMGEIEKELGYPKVIFAREKEGYDFLISNFCLTNVKLSSDLVLQCSDINLDLIYKKGLQIDIPVIQEENIVGIVPNYQCFRHGDSDALQELYRMIINVLLEAEKKVYIFRHSDEDLASCKKIYAMYDMNPNVHLITNNFSCIEYNAFVKQFQFLVCSRFHGIVHAYRNGISCIILGWAVKYFELASSVCQEQYAFNIIDDDFDNKKIQDAVQNMIINFEWESGKITENVRKIQEDNCFDILDKFF